MLVAASIAHVDHFSVEWFARRRALERAKDTWNEPRAVGLWTRLDGRMHLEDLDIEGRRRLDRSFIERCVRREREPC